MSKTSEVGIVETMKSLVLQSEDLERKALIEKTNDNLTGSEDIR